MENILELKQVNDLLEYDFFIPSYQRGYRWTKTQVFDLLKDINEFVPTPDSEGVYTWYCLQPIVVKKDNDKYEVIDGQQRLTTIYLILRYINMGIAESRRGNIYSIEYETRDTSGVYLRNIGEENAQVDNSNIDFYHINKAFEVIENFFVDKDPYQFMSRLKTYTKVIWYECYEDDPIAVFKRLNIGKIPLTNSELIKALFLQRSNFDYSEDRLRIRQKEISHEWDRIEQSLQNDRFWYFFQKEIKYTNRIEFIFDLMSDVENDEDPYRTFYYFSEKKFNNRNKANLNNVWEEVKAHFQRFHEWYNQRDYYHYIGYLIHSDSISVKELYRSASSLNKKEFLNYLLDQIRISIDDVQLDELQYTNRKDVQKVLLLYNILTMLRNAKDNSQFPFDAYIDENWDLEHITSIKEEIPKKNKDNWLSDAKSFIEPNSKDGNLLLLAIDKVDVTDEEQFKMIFEKIVDYFNQHINLEDDINDLWNLTLLDASTNRSYKNAVFPIKRKVIIEKDKSGTFIPLCTKNVFLKYFSTYPPKISFWSSEDKANYRADLIDTLSPFLREI